MKKSSSAVGRATLSAAPAPTSRRQVTTLDDIHRKLASSSALNGGFETLLYKIDKIEQSQGNLVAKVDKIHDAIYDPNDGMFAKLAEHKLESEVKLNEITNNLTEINSWKKHREKAEEKDDAIHDASSAKIATIEKDVDGLVKSKNTAWAILKWFAVAIGGGIITIIVGYLQTKYRLK